MILDAGYFEHPRNLNQCIHGRLPSYLLVPSTSLFFPRVIDLVESLARVSRGKLCEGLNYKTADGRRNLFSLY
jgi:hypothetical protein